MFQSHNDRTYRYTQRISNHLESGFLIRICDDLLTVLMMVETGKAREFSNIRQIIDLLQHLVILYDSATNLI